ncbi:MAG: winged helix-turn-helix domain-containing protein [Phycisphaerales bacterium]
MSVGNTMKAVARITPEEARQLLLSGHGLLGDPTRGSGSGPARAMKTIVKLGFVQVDSINVVERAHHHILWSRDHGYRAAHLDALHRKGKVFEHWTHDASIIPIEHFPHWKRRFDRFEASKWFGSKLGEGRTALLGAVKRRIEQEGPLMARDFEHDGERGESGWWEWKPAKAALEYLWRRGEIMIVRREAFQKVYDLTERALPDAAAAPAASESEHDDWACLSALERLGVATPVEIARFWNAIPPARVREWAAGAVARGVVEAVLVGEGAKGYSALARKDWRAVLRRAAGVHQGARLLSPFDPLVRDRARALRLFGFDYRFEAFVPERARKYGYYVLPVLAGDRLIGRLDAAADRARGVLIVKGVWWEAGVRERSGRKLLESALDHYAAFNGVARWELQG